MSLRNEVRRLGRRLLAVPQVRRAGVAVARRSPALKSLGRRALGVRAGTSTKKRAGKPRIDIRSGNMHLPGQGSRWPIVVVAALGLAPGDTERLAATVERAQLTSGRFRPLFLVDSGELAPFRSRNYAVETVMAQAMYARVNPQDSYAEYVYERTASIVSAYGARSVVPMSMETLDSMPGTVLRLMGALDF